MRIVWHSTRVWDWCMTKDDSCEMIRLMQKRLVVLKHFNSFGSLSQKLI